MRSILIRIKSMIRRAYAMSALLTWPNLYPTHAFQSEFLSGEVN
jgi:hypothetical protein